MSVDFNYPYQIAAGTAAVAGEVQSNFNDLLTWIKTNYRQIDDTPQLTVVPTLPGDPTIPSHAVNKAYADSIVPTGKISEFAGDTAPDGYALCDGSSQSTTGQYQDLFNVIGYKFGGSGGSFNLPDLQGRIPVGKTANAGDFDTVGATGGQADSQLPAHVHNISAYSHSVTNPSGGSHSHTSVSLGVSGTISGGSHTHAISVLNPGSFNDTNVSSGHGGSTNGGLSTDSKSHTHSHSLTASGTVGSGSSGHAHSTSVANHAAKDTASTGDAAANSNYPPYVVLNYIIKT